MDATWNMPQSLHNSLAGESLFAASKADVDAISKVDGAIDVDEAGAILVVDEDVIGIDEAGAISVVNEDAIGVDEAGAISVVDEDATPVAIAGARVEGRKTPNLLTWSCMLPKDKHIPP